MNVNEEGVLDAGMKSDSCEQLRADYQRESSQHDDMDGSMGSDEKNNSEFVGG